MNKQLLLSTGLAFVLGAGGALLGASLVEEAQADEVSWAAIAQDPEFRKAVVEVINFCLVDNSIIYCN